MDALREGSGYSPTQILLLIKGLPLESATVAAMRGGDEFRGWGIDRYHTAALIDEMRVNTYVTAAAAGGKKKPPKPEPSYRPKEKVRRRPKSAEPDKNNPFFQRLEAAKKAKLARMQQQGA